MSSSLSTSSIVKTVGRVLPSFGLSTVKDSSCDILDVENRLNDGIKETPSNKGIMYELKGFNKKEQELISDIMNLLKERLSEDKSKSVYTAYTYLYHCLQSME